MLEDLILEVENNCYDFLKFDDGYAFFDDDGCPVLTVTNDEIWFSESDVIFHKRNNNWLEGIKYGE